MSFKDGVYAIEIKGFSIPVVGMVLSGEKELISLSIIRYKASKNSVRTEILEKNKSFNIYAYRGGRRSFEESVQINGAALQQISTVSLEILNNGEIVTYANMDLLRKTILVKKLDTGISEEEQSASMEKSMSKIIAEQSPLPITDTVMPALTSLLTTSAKECKIVGDANIFPYRKALFVDVNSDDNVYQMKNLIIEDFSKNQFKEKFGRAPQLSSLLHMINPNSFNMKKWNIVLKNFGGRDGFGGLNISTQKSIVWGFEVFEDKIIDIFNHIKDNNIDFNFMPFKELAIFKAKTDLKTDLNKFISKLDLFEDGLLLYAFLSLMSDKNFFKSSSDVLKSKNSIMKYITEREYETIQAGGEAMAIVARSLGLSEHEFKTYQEEYIKSMEKQKDTPKTYPTVSGVIDNEYSWESIDMRNVRAWFVGLETNCCQHLGSVGGSCVLYAANNMKVSGIFRVMKKNKTIAQSFFWYHQDSGTFVFDNIEVLGGELTPKIIEAYKAYCDELEKRKDIFGYKLITFGLGYTDIDYKDFPAVPTERLVKINSMVNGHGVYSDAGSQRILRDLENNK